MGNIQDMIYERTPLALISVSPFFWTTSSPVTQLEGSWRPGRDDDLYTPTAAPLVDDDRLSGYSENRRSSPVSARSSITRQKRLPQRCSSVRQGPNAWRYVTP